MRFPPYLGGVFFAIIASSGPCFGVDRTCIELAYVGDWERAIATLRDLPTRTLEQTLLLSEAYQGLIQMHRRLERGSPASARGRAAELQAERDRILNGGRMPIENYSVTARSLDGLIGQQILPQAWVDWIRALPKTDRILDAGAGQGGVVLQLARRGHRISGLDLRASPDLESVRERSDPDRQLIFNGDMAAFPVGLDHQQFRLILATQTVFNYEPRNTALIARILLEFDRHLLPNGVVMLGSVDRASIEAAMAQARLAAPPGSYRPFRLTIQDQDPVTGAMRLIVAP